MDFKGYELANDDEDSIPVGSLGYISTKYEVFFFFFTLYMCT